MTAALAALHGGTLTVSALGATAVDWITPVLNSPQVEQGEL